MARGTKQIPGQMTLEMCIEQEKYVVQANSLIGGRQALSLNSAKLIRAVIMQIKAEDEDIKPYLITIKRLSELLDVPADNLYRDIDKITGDIIANPVFIKATDGKKVRWIKIPWVEYCQYDSDVGVSIQLNARLKPFLIALQSHYTQYRLESILAMKSVYAIRIFEMLQAKIITRLVPQNGMHVTLTVDEIIEGCELSDTYKRISNLKGRVLNMAVKEINRVTTYYVEYSDIKNGRKVAGFDFFVNMNYH